MEYTSKSDRVQLTISTRVEDIIQKQSAEAFGKPFSELVIDGALTAVQGAMAQVLQKQSGILPVEDTETNITVANSHADGSDLPMSLVDRVFKVIPRVESAHLRVDVNRFGILEILHIRKPKLLRTYSFRSSPD